MISDSCGLCTSLQPCSACFCAPHLPMPPCRRRFSCQYTRGWRTVPIFLVLLVSTRSASAHEVRDTVLDEMLDAVDEGKTNFLTGARNAVQSAPRRSLSGPSNVSSVESSPEGMPSILFTFSSSSTPGWSTGGGAGVYGFTRSSGDTASTGTGPSSGPSGATWYYYAETSSPRSDGDLYRLSYDGSACSSSGGVCEVSFSYHIYGGTLELKRGDDTTVWTKSGNQGNVWYEASVAVGHASFYWEYAQVVGGGRQIRARCCRAET